MAAQHHITSRITHTHITFNDSHPLMTRDVVSRVYAGAVTPHVQPKGMEQLLEVFPKPAATATATASASASADAKGERAADPSFAFVPPHVYQRPPYPLLCSSQRPPHPALKQQTAAAASTSASFTTASAVARSGIDWLVFDPLLDGTAPAASDSGSVQQPPAKKMNLGAGASAVTSASASSSSAAAAESKTGSKKRGLDVSDDSHPSYPPVPSVCASMQTVRAASPLLSAFRPAFGSAFGAQPPSPLLCTSALVRNSVQSVHHKHA